MELSTAKPVAVSMTTIWQSLGFTFIVFTGTESVVNKNEDHNEAVTLGTSRAAAILQSN